MVECGCVECRNKWLSRNFFTHMDSDEFKKYKCFQLCVCTCGLFEFNTPYREICASGFESHPCTCSFNTFSRWRPLLVCLKHPIGIATAYSSCFFGQQRLNTPCRHTYHTRSHSVLWHVERLTARLHSVHFMLAH